MAMKENDADSKVVWRDRFLQLRDCCERLQAQRDRIEAALPDTFYADLPIDKRVARMADEWRRATCPLGLHRQRCSCPPKNKALAAITLGRRYLGWRA